MLFEEHDPSRPASPSWWITPGGGLEAGETFAQAAFRELEEETGLRADELHGPILSHEFEYSYLGTATRQFEFFFVACSENPTLSFNGWTPFEQQVTRTARWWTLADIEEAEVIIFPKELPGLVRSLDSPGLRSMRRISRERDTARSIVE